MRKTAIFFLILLLQLWIPLVNSAPDEGYGEANENLGQFTDTFMNETYVSVLHDVIVNTTLECAELNYTRSIIDYEDFTEYTEVDIGSDRIQITAQHIDHLMRRDETTYSYRDYGVGYFTDFEHWMDINTVSASTTNAVGVAWIVSNVLAESEDLWSNNNQAILLYFVCAVGPTYRYYLLDCEAGTLSPFIVVNINTMYYMKIIKSGTSVILTIYPTAQDRIDNLNAVGTTSINLGTDRSYRYVFAGSSWDSGDAVYIVVMDIENFWWGDYLGGYELLGYFVTEDYLNYTNGNSLTLLTNSSIPEGTTITVEFSEDNLTWAFNDWEPIFGGFEAIDLRVLNYSDIYLRYNFSGTRIETPRLFQSRLVSTEGETGAVTITTVESDAPWIAVAIILSIIAFLLATRIKR